eukprot:gene10197-8110_t
MSYDAKVQVNPRAPDLKSRLYGWLLSEAVGQLGTLGHPSWKVPQALMGAAGNALNRSLGSTGWTSHCLVLGCQLLLLAVDYHAPVGRNGTRTARRGSGMQLMRKSLNNVTDLAGADDQVVADAANNVLRMYYGVTF